MKLTKLLPLLILSCFAGTATAKLSQLPPDVRKELETDFREFHGENLRLRKAHNKEMKSRELDLLKEKHRLQDEAFEKMVNLQEKKTFGDREKNQDINRELKELRQEQKREMRERRREARQEMKQIQREFRQEMKARRKEFRQKMKAKRKELKKRLKEGKKSQKTSHLLDASFDYKLVELRQDLL